MADFVHLTNISNFEPMSIEVQKPLINITRETAGGPGPGGNTDLEFNNVLQGQITDGTTIDVNLEDPNGNLVTPLSVGLAGNTLSIEIGVETPVEVNAVPVGDIPNGPILFVNCEDPVGNPITPNSSTLTGSQLDIVFPAPIVPSGVLFEFPKGENWTSWRTGDPGWRAQNGWYDIPIPANPAKIARLDYGTANFWYLLETALTVDGVSSTRRFVDVDGGQTFSAALNKDKVVIDKLTGLMFLRSTILVANWSGGIDDALAYSIAVDGVTYDDWYLISMEENIALTGFNWVLGASGTFDWLDATTGVRLASFNNNMVTATSYNSTTAQRYRVNPYFYDSVSKTTASPYAWYIRDARNLIS